MKLIDHLLTEADITDKITNRTELTYKDFIDAILKLDGQQAKGPQKIRELMDVFGLPKHTINRYLINAKNNGFINDDGTIPDQYKSGSGSASSVISSQPAVAEPTVQAAPAPATPPPAPATPPTPKIQPKSSPAPATPPPAPATPPKSSPVIEPDETEQETEDDSDMGPKGGSGGNLSKNLDAKELKFIAPKVTNNNLFSKQVFKMLSLMDGQASKSGVKNSLMLTGDPGVGKCLCGDQEIVVDVDEQLFDKLMELKNKR